MSDRLLVASRKGLFTITRSATGTWAVANLAFEGDNVSLAMHDKRDGTIYAALDHGHFGCKMHRSGDGGETWEEIAPPKYPEMPEGWEPELRPIMGEPPKWNLRLIWALTPGGADQPGRVWCGTIPGGLFRSDDRGTTWQLNRPLWDDPRRGLWFGGGADWPGIHSIQVDPANSKRVMIAVSCGGVWLTEDDGATWHLRSENGLDAAFMPEDAPHKGVGQDPHQVVACPAKWSTWWMQHHDCIYHSADEGQQWTKINEVSPSPFGFAVAVHPKDADTAWFVPAKKDEKRMPVDGKIVVNRTRDGGKTFETLRNGLPQEHAYDLVYRHCLDIDASGNRLAFGSTTGGLWLTENQGDTWTNLSTNLPPIYAVRFA